MNIKLFLKEKEIKLVLIDGEKIIDQRDWIDENNLLERFFPILDENLIKNSLDISDIDDFILENNIPVGYTTARIAQTIIKALNFAQKS